MNTVFNATHRASLTRRLDALTPDSKPRWGKMDCPRMLAHVADGLRMALGELAVKPKRGPLRFPPLRHAIIYWVPFPKGAPSAPELLARRAENCAEETAELKRLIEQLAAREGAREWPEHPAFGQLNGRDWGALMHKHIDHHLKQFGV